MRPLRPSETARDTNGKQSACSVRRETVPVVRECAAALQAAGITTPMNSTQLEACFGAKVLTEAIRRVYRGNKYVSPGLAERLAADLAVGSRDIRHEGLSNREYEVLCLLGSGQTVKAANQLIVAVNIEVLGEAIAFLEAYGVDTDAALKVLGGGLAGSKVLDQKGQKMLDRNFKPGFRIRLHEKDMKIALATGSEYGVPLMVTGAVGQMMTAMKGMGNGDLDHSALVKFVEELAKKELAG